MSLFQVFDAFDKYSFDILTLAFLVVILTSFVKRAIFKNKFKKVITFVPFVLGIAVYAGSLYFFKKMPISKLADLHILENGFITGGVSTVYYIFYEQFIRQKKTGKSIGNIAVEGILSAIVVKEFLESVADQIITATAGRLQDKSYCITIISDAVSGKLKNGTTELDVLTHAKLIITSLSVL